MDARKGSGGAGDRLESSRQARKKHAQNPHREGNWKGSEAKAREYQKKTDTHG